jgi:hypothetical protein
MLLTGEDHNGITKCFEERRQHQSNRKIHCRSGAVGALAIGAVAFGAMAIGALAIGRLVIGKSKIDSLKIGNLEVDELRGRKLEVTGKQLLSACLSQSKTRPRHGQMIELAKSHPRLTLFCNAAHGGLFRPSPPGGKRNGL